MKKNENLSDLTKNEEKLYKFDEEYQTNYFKQKPWEKE
jgi:hypothetical protein